MTDFTPELIALDDVDAGELNIYNPDEDNVLSALFVVRIKREVDPSQYTDFQCQHVESSRVFLELTPELAFYIQKESSKEFDPDGEFDIETVKLSRAMNKFNRAAVRLGLVKPVLTEAQIAKLPPIVLRDLQEAITDTIPEPVSEEENDDEKSE